MKIQQNPVNLECDKELFFQEYIKKKIPADLQSSYRETIQSIRAGFEAGVRFVLENYKVDSK